MLFRSAFVGPGYLVSVGYMDPGNWATDLAGGSKFGYTLLSVIPRPLRRPVHRSAPGAPALDGRPPCAAPRFTVLIGGAYSVVIPVFFSDYKTYSILIVGTTIATLIGGYIGYKASLADTPLIKICVSFLYATVVAITVLLLSLFIILNVRGS